jgi:hypothetical protein
VAFVSYNIGGNVKHTTLGNFTAGHNVIEEFEIGLGFEGRHT